MILTIFKVFKRLGVKQKIYRRIRFEIFRWPFVTFEIIFNFSKNKMRLYILSIHRNFYQIGSLNEFVRKKKAKIPESRSTGVFFSEI